MGMRLVFLECYTCFDWKESILSSKSECNHLRLLTAVWAQQEGLLLGTMQCDLLWCVRRIADLRAWMSVCACICVLNIAYVMRRMLNFLKCARVPSESFAEPQQWLGSSRMLIFKQSEQAAGGWLIMTKVSAGRWSAPQNALHMFKACGITFDSAKHRANVHNPPSFTFTPSVVQLLPPPRR